METTSFSRVALGIFTLGFAFVVAGCGDDDGVPSTDSGVAMDAGGGTGDGGGGGGDGAVPVDAGGGGADGAVAVDSGGGGGSDGGGGGGDGGYVCYGTGSSFPTFEKGCAMDMNCSLVFHQMDCCGGEVGMGINHAGRTAFDAAESAHRMMCPATCECAARFIDEAGAMSSTGEAGIGVSCVGGTCIAAVL